MDSTRAVGRLLSRALAAGVVAFALVLQFFGSAYAADPIRVGLSVSLTGPTASAGKQVLAGLQIWRDDANANGGLLGRPIELVYYDDQGNPAAAPGIYTKLIDVDKVDLLIGPYSTNVIAAALPTIMQSRRTTIGIFGLGANNVFQYPNYFSMNSQGPATANYSKCLFEIAAAQTPKPVRVALVGADVEYSRNALDGAKANAKAMGFEVVYERTYPAGTTDLIPVVRAMQAANPDVVFGATLPVDTVGLVRAVTETNFKPKLIGGAMLGLLITSIKQQLGASINGYVSNEFYIPAPSLQFAGTKEMIAKYQERAAALGTDPLGYTYPPYAYAAGQILAQAVSATKSTDSDTLAAYLRGSKFDTVIGPIEFGPNGEWKTPRIICVQFQNIDGSGIEQFRDWTRQVVVYPPAYRTGDVIYPFSKAEGVH
jgi:branched-chain amino acid transport system substrate-binding protein